MENGKKTELIDCLEKFIDRLTASKLTKEAAGVLKAAKKKLEALKGATLQPTTAPQKETTPETPEEPKEDEEGDKE